MGIFEELFGLTPEGNYETKDTTTFIESVFGERSAEVRDKRTDEVGRGKGDNARDAKSNAFHHLKEASPYDPDYTPGPKPQEDTSSGRGYSGGCDWSSGGSGGGSSINTGIGGLVGLVGAIIIGGAICFNIFGEKSNPIPPQPKPQVSYSAQQGTDTNLSLEENIVKLSRYLKDNNQLSGNFNDYRLVKTPTTIRDANKTNLGNQDYEIAFVSPSSFYVFHSSNGGVTWEPMPPRDPFLLRFYEEYSRENQRQWKKNNESESEDSLDQIIEQDIKRLKETKPNKIDSFEGQIKNTPKISELQADSEEDSDYFEKKRQQESKEERIREKYDKIYNLNMLRRNRFKSKFQIEQQVRENMEKELRGEIPNYNK